MAFWNAILTIIQISKKKSKKRKDTSISRGYLYKKSYLWARKHYLDLFRFLLLKNRDDDLEKRVFV